MHAHNFEQYDNADAGPGIAATGAAAEVVVYGADWCPWTTRQKTELTEAGIKYTFTDCQKEECPGITGFPTIQIAGEQLPGFKDAAAVRTLLGN